MTRFDGISFRLIFMSAALGALAGAALAAQSLAQSSGAVAINGFKFGPDTVTVSAKAPITWTNNDGAPHQIVVASKNLKTPVLQKGNSGQLSIAEAGSYDYVCGIHPSMKGKIVVK
jgi:plastocyanin